MQTTVRIGLHVVHVNYSPDSQAYVTDGVPMSFRENILMFQLAQLWLGERQYSVAIAPKQYHCGLNRHPKHPSFGLSLTHGGNPLACPRVQIVVSWSFTSSLHRKLLLLTW
jgi:hypothetical protein